MKKIPSLFERNYDTDNLVRDEVVPGSEWVQNGEGIATRKYDGTCCLILAREIYARYDVKNGKIPPNDFIPAQDPDPITGHWPGWIKGNRNDNRYKYHFEALFGISLPDGTYELCGPKIQGNPEKLLGHYLISHEHAHPFHDAPRTFNEIKEWFKGKDIEGIVWHHPDGRMVKIKKKDFGMRRDE